MSYKITSVGPDKEITTQNGKFKVYSIQLEGVGWVELMQKPETAAPNAGQELEGTVEDTQYGKRFKKAQGAGGSFGGNRAQDPATRSSIERQSALKASVDAVRDYYAIVPDPELTLEKYVTKVVNVTNIFTKAIAGADAKQPEAQAQHSEVLGGQEVDQLPGEKPETDQINLDDIPF
jgi:hypothetical protein